MNTNTKVIELKAAKRFQNAFTKKGIIIKEILNSLRDSSIDIEGEIKSISRFSESGEASIETSTNRYFLCINW